ncbi:hypothetical protein B0A48_13744 [Cryoendolithus antarcticus]|uniref:BTB domain-containing protein n=1 Tax=Cryoendolithus antarcticus TaxID=1507870 RepID=A0A1V8SMK0_9PEZI|nr:hypothetical protein B0A48_13744 [Cryoendolithus antarcticus]
MNVAGNPSKVLKRFQILYETGQTVDFEILCNDRVWKEAKGKRLNLSGEDEDGVDALVRYMYYFKYERTEETYLKHVNVAILADKYDLPDLVALADQAMAAMITSRPLECTTDLMAAAELAYESEGPTTAFRTALLDATLDLDQSAPKGRALLSALVRALPRLAQDLVLATIEHAPIAKPEPSTGQGPCVSFCTACKRDVFLLEVIEKGKQGGITHYNCIGCEKRVTALD